MSTNSNISLFLALFSTAMLFSFCSIEACTDTKSQKGFDSTKFNNSADVKNFIQNSTRKANKDTSSVSMKKNNIKNESLLKWLTYINDDFGFLIKYPQSYEFVLDNPFFRGTFPKPLFTLYFKHKVSLNSDTTVIEPPQFLIEIFVYSSKVPYQNWLRQRGMLPSKSMLEDIIVSGRKALRVTRQEFIAPGQFVFLAKDDRIFRFTLFGEHSKSMLESFFFIDNR